MSKKSNAAKLPKLSPKTETGKATSRAFPAWGLQEHWKTWLPGAAVIFLAVFLAYQPVRHASFIWDDNIMLTENPLLKTADGLRDIWFSTKPHDYFPLTLTSFGLEWRLWKMNPAGYLLVNAFLHALGAILFWRLLRRLRIPAPWLTALLFALHPVAVASVAWVAERKNTLSLVFYGWTFLAYFRFEETGQRRLYILALFAFLLALLSKTSVVMVPVLLLGCAWWQRGRIGAQDVWRSVPFFTLSLVLGLVTVWFQKHRAIGDAATDIPVEALSARLLGGSWGLWFYLGKALAPVHLSVIYPRWEINPASGVMYLPGLLWLGALVVFWKFRQTWGRPLLAAFGYVFLTLWPLLGFFNMSYLMHSRVADHWQYLALIGPLALVVGGGTHFLKTSFRLNRAVLRAIGATLVIVFFALAGGRVRLYSQPETLWQETLRENPQAFAAHNNLARLYVQRGEWPKAQAHFAEAVRLKPESPQTQQNLGKVLFDQGKIQEAVSPLMESVRLNPHDFTAQMNLADALCQLGRNDEAVPHFQAALRLNPHSFFAHNYLGSVLGMKGLLDEAMGHYRSALRLQPDFYEAQFNLGLALAKQGRAAEAKSYFSAVLRLRPDNGTAHRELAKILEKEGDAAKSAFHFAQGHYFQALRLLEEKQVDGAKHYLGEALRIDPALAEAHYQLGVLLRAEGQAEEAARHFEETLRLAPGHAAARRQAGK